MAANTDYRARYGDWSLVVGASEGLGEAIACDLARRGMNVAMVARGEAKLRAAAERVATEFKVETRPIPADLGAPDVLATLLAGLRGVEVGMFVYNCAAEHGGEFLAQDLDRHLTNIQVNCVAPTVLTHHFGREMAARGRGGIVLATSGAANNGLYAWGSYGGSKAYEMLLGQTLWYELARQGVDATAFMIGSTYTPNFQRNQQIRGTAFAETRTPEGLAPGTPLPQDPRDASANLFAQLDVEWIPMVYANPRDEESFKASNALTLAERVTRSSDAVRTSFEATASAKGKPLII